LAKLFPGDDGTSTHQHLRKPFSGRDNRFCRSGRAKGKLDDRQPTLNQCFRQEWSIICPIQLDNWDQTMICDLGEERVNHSEDTKPLSYSTVRFYFVHGASDVPGVGRQLPTAFAV